MCFVISMVLLVLSYNLYISQNILGAVGSFLAAAFFIYLMVKNIQRVKEIKKNEREKKSDS